MERVKAQDERLTQSLLGWSAAKPVRAIISADLSRKTQQKHHPSSGLLFINQITHKTTTQNRKAVRSHVMFNYRSHERKSRKKIELKGRWGLLYSNVEPELNVVPNLQRVLGSGRIDPFDSFSIPMTNSMSRLFDNYSTIIGPLHFPPTHIAGRNPMTNTWIPTALADVALLHSTLSFSAGIFLPNNAGQTNRVDESVYEYLLHKTETIKIINTRMADMSKALTDETLGAIALLITCETSRGDYHEMNINMKGLAQLVTLKGGLDALGMGGLLAGEVICCDNLNAILSSCKPLLSLPGERHGPFEHFEDTKLNRFFVRNQNNEIDSVDKSFNLADVLCKDLLMAFRHLQDLTDFLDSFPVLSEFDMLVYDRKRGVVQHQLADISVSPVSGDFYYNESCQIAAIIYSFLALWGFPPPMLFYGDLAKRLQAALWGTNLHNQWESRWSILLWALFVGGYAALRTLEREWYVERIREIAWKQGLRTWHDVKEALRRVLVYERLLAPFLVLWCEVEVLIL